MIDYTKPVQTVSGEPVEIITTKGRGDYPIVGYSGVYSEILTWTVEGLHVKGKSNQEDLINVSGKPKTIVRWFNVYSDQYVEDFSTKVGADISAMKTRIACKRVEFTEGEYDE